MSGTSQLFGQQLLQLIFNGTSISGIADNTATTPLTQLYCALHTADPGTASAQTTNEISNANPGPYTNYARVAINRNTGGWTVTNNAVSPVNSIVWPAVSGNGTVVTATYWSVGTAASGAGEILFSGPLTPSIGCTNGGGSPTLLNSSSISET